MPETKKIKKRGRSHRDCFEWFVQWDGYGTPITMNYKGDDTFRTVPGTLLTILSNVFLLYTLFIKGR
jgi:hypothetical protein